MTKSKKLEMEGMPVNEEAERALLAIVQKHPRVLEEKLIHGWRPEMFSIPAHLHTFNAMSAVYRKTKGIGFNAVKQKLIAEGLLEEVGGIEGLEIFWRETNDNLTWAVGQMAETYFRRQAIVAANSVSRSALDKGCDTLEIRQHVAKTFKDLSQMWTHQRRRPHKEQLNATVDWIAAQAEITMEDRITFGIPMIDNAILGITAPNYGVISAPPSGGKTALALQLARRTAKKGKKVAIFSLEMDSVELYVRLIAAESGVHMRHLREGKVTPEEGRRFSAAVAEMVKWPLFVSEEKNQTIEGIKSEAYEIKAEYGLDLLIVDYLQLLRSPSAKIQTASDRQVFIAGVSGELKTFAKEINAPVIVLSQVNDDGQYRESRAIGQDADVALFVIVEKKQPRCIEIGKARNEERGLIVPITFEGWIQTFKERSAKAVE